MCCDRDLVHECTSIEQLQFSCSRMSRIRQIALIDASRQGAQTLPVRWCVAYRVQEFHVANVVDVQTLLQTHDQSQSVQFHGQNRVRVAVVAYFSVPFEMADFQFPGRRQTDQRHQTRGEQSFYDTNVLIVCITGSRDRIWEDGLESEAGLKLLTVCVYLFQVFGIPESIETIATLRPDSQ